MGSSRRSGRPDRRPDAVACGGGRRTDRDDIDGAIAEALRRLPADATIVVALSGGVDSIVLLDALAQRWPARQLVAWHVHHGLQQQADRWSTVCEREAARLGVRFGASRVQARGAQAGNVEGWARKVRYEALWNAVAQTGAVALFTAHQADDQLETVMMRLARGSGPEALGGMAAAQRRKGGWLLRPLLSIGRDRILERARARRLQWIDDPMNADQRFLRVVLRTRVIPELARSVPSLRENVLRSAELLRESGETLRWLASEDLRVAGLSADARTIDRRALASLPAQRRDRAVRAWLRMLGATMPNRARLEQWVAQMLLGASTSAQVVHEGWRFRRYRDRIEVEAPPPEPEPATQSFRAGASSTGDAPVRPPLRFRWQGERSLALPGWQGSLFFEASDAPHAIDADWLAGQTLEARSPRSGWRLRPRPGGPSRTLKNLFQEHGVPPWLRPSMPALFAGGGLLYVASLGMDCSAGQKTSTARVIIGWRPDDPRDARAAYCEGHSPV